MRREEKLEIAELFSLNVYLFTLRIFSSPEPKAPGELIV